MRVRVANAATASHAQPTATRRSSRRRVRANVRIARSASRPYSDAPPIIRTSAPRLPDAGTAGTCVGHSIPAAPRARTPDRQRGLEREQRAHPPRVAQAGQRGQRQQRRAGRERQAAGQCDDPVGADEHARGREAVDREHGGHRRERGAEQRGLPVAAPDRRRRSGRRRRTRRPRRRSRPGRSARRPEIATLAAPNCSSTAPGNRAEAASSASGPGRCRSMAG